MRRLAYVLSIRCLDPYATKVEESLRTFDGTYRRLWWVISHNCHENGLELDVQRSIQKQMEDDGAEPKEEREQSGSETRADQQTLGAALILLSIYWSTLRAPRSISSFLPKVLQAYF